MDEFLAAVEPEVYFGEAVVTLPLPTPQNRTESHVLKWPIELFLTRRMLASANLSVHMVKIQDGIMSKLLLSCMGKR